MSPAPVDAKSRAKLEDYRASWQAIMQLVRNGSSWSGRERNCAFLNCGGGPGDESRSDPTARHASVDHQRFANVAAVTGLDLPDDGRAMAIVDWDQDGDLDIWLRNRTAPRLRLMLNRTRTESGSGPGFVRFKLQGTRSNRDAIGARVELVLDDGTAALPLIQTCRAGEAFMSQSSRWLHFGVGTSRTIREVIVMWPGGERQRFEGAQVGRHYLVNEGDPALQIWNRPTPVALAKLPAVELPRATAAARVILPGKARFPSLTLTDPSMTDVAPTSSRGTSRPSLTTAQQATLLVLWTASCMNCCQELAELAQHKAELANAGIDVIAVSLDQLEESAGSGVSTERGDNYLRQIGFPFRAAMTDADSVRRLQAFQNALFDKYPEFVVPLSFLLDPQGRVVTIYRGVFPIDVYRQDVKLTRYDDGQLRDAAVPFAGRWFTKPATGSQFAEFIARHLVERDPAEALQYYRAAAELDPQNAHARQTVQALEKYLGSRNP